MFPQKFSDMDLFSGPECVRSVRYMPSIFVLQSYDPDYVIPSNCLAFVNGHSDCTLNRVPCVAFR